MNVESGILNCRNAAHFELGIRQSRYFEAISKKDFALRIKICRKEAKESEYWLSLLDTDGDKALESERRHLQNEAIELVKIFNAIVQKTSQ